MLPGCGTDLIFFFFFGMWLFIGCLLDIFVTVQHEWEDQNQIPLPFPPNVHVQINDIIKCHHTSVKQPGNCWLIWYLGKWMDLNKAEEITGLKTQKTWIDVIFSEQYACIFCDEQILCKNSRETAKTLQKLLPLSHLLDLIVKRLRFADLRSKFRHKPGFVRLLLRACLTIRLILLMCTCFNGQALSNDPIRTKKMRII